MFTLLLILPLTQLFIQAFSKGQTILQIDGNVDFSSIILKASSILSSFNSLINRGMLLLTKQPSTHKGFLH